MPETRQRPMNREQAMSATEIKDAELDAFLREVAELEPFTNGATQWDVGSYYDPRTREDRIEMWRPLPDAKHHNHDSVDVVPHRVAELIAEVLRLRKSESRLESAEQALTRISNICGESPEDPCGGCKDRQLIARAWLDECTRSEKANE